MNDVKMKFRRQILKTAFTSEHGAHEFVQLPKCRIAWRVYQKWLYLWRALDRLLDRQTFNTSWDISDVKTDCLVAVVE